MIAAVVRGAGIELDREAAEPRAGDGVLVQMEAACIAPLDLQIAAGQFPLRPPEDMGRAAVWIAEQAPLALTGQKFTDLEILQKLKEG